jgi:hypothetical protein
VNYNALVKLGINTMQQILLFQEEQLKQLKHLNHLEKHYILVELFWKHVLKLFLCRQLMVTQTYGLLTQVPPVTWRVVMKECLIVKQ